MKWNIVLALVSVILLVIFTSSGLTLHMAQAEGIADDLAPLIGVDQNLIREHLELILRKGSMRRTIIYCSPLAILSLLLTVRLIADARLNHR